MTCAVCDYCHNNTICPKCGSDHNLFDEANDTEDYSESENENDEN